MANSFQSKHHEIYWCEICDMSQVDSEKPETGTFFVQSGRVLDRMTGDINNWETVVFAVCKFCCKKTVINPFLSFPP